LLNNLLINNYTLIDDINVAFANGFSCITGETGAGKSILLGGLSLVLGKRADLSSLRNKERKCIVEAEFEIAPYNLRAFFEDHDLDYESRTIIRREILPSGKSRAFINDTPVTLGILSQLGDRLVDVHSQHQTLRLTDHDFQLKVVDAMADNKEILDVYHKELQAYQTASKELEHLIDFQRNAIKEHDYNSFLLQELKSASLQEGMQESLEEQYEQLNNVETIVEQLSRGHQLLNDEQIGVLNLLIELRQAAGRLATFGHQYAQLNERIESLYIEIDDISTELQSFMEQAEADPKLLEEVGARLQLLYDLQKKHGAQHVPELLAIMQELEEKVATTENLDKEISEMEHQVAIKKKALEEISEALGQRRASVLPELKKYLEERLDTLGMPSATFALEIKTSEKFKHNGKNDLIFLFSANKGTNFGELKKVASGGELSRIMLTIKAILARYENLPTIMFDEIDTGVSGEISNRMGDIMHDMGKTMQVFSITHLPQVASKGDHHFKVYKTDEGGVTRTQMKKLDPDERVVELAEMLGGKELTDSAMAHARQLLN